MAPPSTLVSPVRPPRHHRRALAALGLVLALGIFATACTSAEEDHGTALVNQARSSNGVGSLSSNVPLILTAQAWSQQLAKNGSLSHRSPLSAGAPAGWLKLGENVGYGSSVDVVQGAFMNSAGHRANILDPAFNNIGVGVTVDGSGRRWVVQEFADL
jgi:uncharacterized protein YkwD